MHDSLVVIKDSELLISECVWLQCHLEFMRWLRWSLQAVCLCLMDPLDEVKTSIALAGLFSRERISPGGLLRIVLSSDEPVEPVHCLPLVPGWFELSRVQAEGVMWTACALLVWPVQQGP